MLGAPSIFLVVHGGPVSRRSLHFAHVGIGGLKKEEVVFTEPLKGFQRVGGHGCCIFRVRVDEIGGLPHDNSTEIRAMLYKLWKHGHRSPDFQSEPVARNRVRHCVLLEYELLDDGARKLHGELLERTLFQRGPQTVPRMEKEIRRDARMVVQVGENLVVDEVRGKFIQKVRRHRGRKVHGHCG